MVTLLDYNAKLPVGGKYPIYSEAIMDGNTLVSHLSFYRISDWNGISSYVNPVLRDWEIQRKDFTIAEREALEKYITPTTMYNFNSTDFGEWGVEVNQEYKIFERSDTNGIKAWVGNYKYKELTPLEYQEKSGDYVVDTSVTYWTYDNPPQYNEVMPPELDLSNAAVWAGPFKYTSHYLVDMTSTYTPIVIPNRYDSFGENGVYYKHIVEDTNYKYLTTDMELFSDPLYKSFIPNYNKINIGPIDRGYCTNQYKESKIEDDIIVGEITKEYYTKNKWELILNKYLYGARSNTLLESDSRDFYHLDGTKIEATMPSMIPLNYFKYTVYGDPYDRGKVKILVDPEKLPNGVTLDSDYAIAIWDNKVWGYRPKIVEGWESTPLFDNDLTSINPSMDFGWELIFELIEEEYSSSNYIYLLKEFTHVKWSTDGSINDDGYAVPSSNHRGEYFTYLANLYDQNSSIMGRYLGNEDPTEYGYKIGHYDVISKEHIYNPNKDYLPHTVNISGNIRRIYKGIAPYIEDTFAFLPKDILGSVNYTKTVNEGDSIDFTTVASASITAQLNYPVEEINKFTGENFTYLLDYGDGVWRPIGIFSIDEVESIDAYTTRITGHDHMYRLNRYVDDFIASYSYPTSLKKFWYDLLDYCDIFYDTDEPLEVNTDLQLNKNFEAVKTTGLQIAGYIVQLMGGFAHIKNYGASISHYVNTSLNLKPSNYYDISYASYTSEVPNLIKIGFNNGKTISTSEPISGTYKQVLYYITNNALITYNIDEAQCRTLLSNLREVLKALPLDYRKCSIKMLTPLDNYDIKVGDIISITTKLNTTFKMMVMEISIDSSGITYSSFGEINYPVEGENITSQIIYLEDTRRELNNVIDDMGYVAEDLININDKFDEVDNSINNLNNSISNTDNKLNNYITTNNNRVDALGDAVNGTAQSIIDLSNLTKEFKSTASNDGLATINLTNTLSGVVLDSRLQAQTTALLNAINGKCGIVYMTHDDNENIPQKGYALNIGKSDLYISICNFDLSSTMTVSTVYLYFFIIMNNKIISRGRFNAMN